MNPKFRYLYLLIAAGLLFLLIYQVVIVLPDIDPIRILVIAVPDLVFFFLAYKTYPPEMEDKRQQSYQHRKVTNF